jgi:hypothetical protein
MSSSHDIDRWIAELRAAGWTEQSMNVWCSPDGLRYRGPYRAWTVLKMLSYPDHQRSNDD